ncbi:hypothetical protein Q8A73_019941 [Channa argus]|nr:hypothetical protein Q8A73_019941 [Channa argus]
MLRQFGSQLTNTTAVSVPEPVSAPKVKSVSIQPATVPELTIILPVSKLVNTSSLFWSCTWDDRHELSDNSPALLPNGSSHWHQSPRRPPFQLPAAQPQEGFIHHR